MARGRKMIGKKLKAAHRRYQHKLINLSNTEKERLKTVEKMAKELMGKYGVTHYRFRFGWGWKYLGRCDADTITILLNFALTGNLDDIKNTILHEIAHAIVGENHGHRQVWQEKAIELGVKFRRNYHK